MFAGDLALYRAKSLGQCKICGYEPSMDETSRTRAELAIDLKRALAGNEFELYYQAPNDVVSGEIVGLEALLRWNHRRRDASRLTILYPLQRKPA